MASFDTLSNPPASITFSVMFKAFFFHEIGLKKSSKFFLLTFIVAILISAKLIEVIFKKYNLFNLFNYSFSTNDGELNNLIEVESKVKLNYLETNPNLIYFSYADGLYIYKIVSNDRKKIDDLKNKLQSNNQIKNLEIRYVK